MNAFSFNQRLSARILAVVALFSLVASMVPMQAFAAPGEVNTVSGSCGAPVNVNQYEVGQAVLLKGKNFSPNVTLNWDITEVGGANPTVLASGTIGTDSAGEFCFTAINALPANSDLESPYKATAGDKSDNFSVVQAANNNGTITVVKQLVNPPQAATADDFSFTVNGGTATQFEADGSNASIQNLNDGPFTVVEVEANGTGYTTSYQGCSAIALTNSGATCTITNTYAQVSSTGTLTINKVISGIGGILTSAFNFVVNAGASVAFEADGSNTVASVPAGAYTVVEASVAGGQVVVGPNTYNVGYSAGCSGTLAANGTADCTITNTFVPANSVPGCMDVDANNYEVDATVDDGSCLYDLTVNKVITASTSPNYTLFSFQVDGGASIPFEADGSNIVEVSSTTHSVVEDAEAGYTTAYSNCDDVVVTGNDAVCTVTNTPVGIPTGTLDIVKVVVGTTTVDESAFSFKLDGGATTTFETDGTNSLTLVVGTYDVVETPATGYTTTYNNCDNVVVTDGQTSTCTITNTLIVPGPATCTVEIVSNTSANVVEKSAFAQALTFIHGAWTASIPGATWIWGDDPVVDPTATSTQTFQNQFGFIGTVTNATLYVASDNGHSAILNGNSAMVGSSSFSSAVNYDVTSQILQGNNELNIAVTNIGVASSTPDANPAGALYKLVIEGEVTSDADCATPYNNGGGNPDLSCTITVDDADIRRGDDVTLTWSSIGAVLASLDGATTTTSGQLLVQDVDSDATYTLTVTDAQDNDATCSVAVDTRSGGGGGGGGGNRIGNRPSVLGDSDDADEPAGQVLGDQVSAVPLGAADAGSGSTAPVAVEFFRLAPVAFIRRK